MELEAAALAMLASPHRVRYSKVVVHLFHWAKDEKRVIDAIQGLADTLRSEYQYMCKVQAIQASAEGCHWVLNEAMRVFDADDNREVMKIYYFGGHSYLKDGQMMISSCQEPDSPAFSFTIVRSFLKRSRSDILVILDSALYPAADMSQKAAGSIEMIAACPGSENAMPVDRAAFAEMLAEIFRERARHPLSAAQLHARLMSLYMERKESATGDGTLAWLLPFYIQGFPVDRNPGLPSVALAPLMRGKTPMGPALASDIHVKVRLQNPCALDPIKEWLRRMPDTVRDVQVDIALPPSLGREGRQ